MKILVEFELSDGYEAYYSSDEDRIKGILKHQLEGVTFEIKYQNIIELKLSELDKSKSINNKKS